MFHESWITRSPSVMIGTKCWPDSARIVSTSEKRTWRNWGSRPLCASAQRIRHENGLGLLPSCPMRSYIVRVMAEHRFDHGGLEQPCRLPMADPCLAQLGI